MTSLESHHDDQIAPELAPLSLPEKPDGPGAAAMLAAGIGIFVIGLLTVLNEASAGMHTFLAKWEFGQGVGPLAGKTMIGSIAFFVSWGVLHVAWRTKNIDLKRAFWIGIALGALGALFMFPPFFTAFAAE